MTPDQRRLIDRAVRYARLAPTLTKHEDRDTVCGVARELVDKVSEQR